MNRKKTIHPEIGYAFRGRASVQTDEHIADIDNEVEIVKSRSSGIGIATVIYFLYFCLTAIGKQHYVLSCSEFSQLIRTF